MTEFTTRSGQGKAIAGRKGRETRRRILDAVEERCLEVHHRAIKVSEVAAAAGTSPATFYYYFPDIAEAAAEAARRHLEPFDMVVQAANRLTHEDATDTDFEVFVRAFYDYWSTRPGLLETIVASSADEDPRFFRVLLRLMMSVTYALAPAVQNAHAVGVAGSLVMMLTSSAARVDGFDRDGVSKDELIASQVLIIRATLGAVRA